MEISSGGKKKKELKPKQAHFLLRMALHMTKELNIVLWEVKIMIFTEESMDQTTRDLLICSSASQPMTLTELHSELR